MNDPAAGVRLVTVSVRLVDGGRHHHVSEARVRYYVDRAPASWPRLSLVRRGRRYQLVDGAHRTTAARRLGLTRVRASVIGWEAWREWLAGRRRLSWRRWE